MAAQRKHKEVTVQAKYEASQELDRGRSNKDVTNQFDIPWQYPFNLEETQRKTFRSFSKFIGKTTKS